MQYNGLAALLACLAGLILLLALFKGWRLAWLLPWLKGNLLLLVMAFAGVLGLSAWELHQFRTLQPGNVVASLEFRKTAEQQYQVVFVADGDLRRLPLAGDLWELDAQVVHWRGIGHAIGLQDGYRLHRLAGRYLALEQQREVNLGYTDQLHPTPAWRDLWRWLDRSGTQSVLEAAAFSVRFMPMADGAKFNIEIGATGLTPVPVNQQAMDALKRVQ
ncbi:MAG: hypothetical protein CVV16_00735 [Gammaproteobacteria bacterium HGW-Gammaproteobacteria-6]|nr:MAG: hypothetical protein CVV16_00735 [Gammaproteobacteria bacterium HGW-Gammaproteobacteria-6]